MHTCPLAYTQTKNTYRSAGQPVSIQFMLLANHTETINRCLWPAGVGLNYKCRLRPILMSVGQSPPRPNPSGNKPRTKAPLILGRTSTPMDKNPPQESFELVVCEINNI